MSDNLEILLLQIAAVLGVGIAAVCLVLLLADIVVKTARLFVRKQIVSVEMNAADLFVTASPERLILLNFLLSTLVIVAAYTISESLIITGIFAALMMLLPGYYWSSLRAKRFKKIEEQLPDAFMMLASSLQAGASINSAFQSVASQIKPPLAQELLIVTRKVQVGITLDQALLEMEQRAPIDSLIIASSAVRISREIGGNLVHTIKSISATLRRKFTMEGKIDSLTAQGRAQGRFMAALPILVAAGLSVIDPDSMSKLISTPIGYGVTAVMVVMQVLGFVFIRKTTSIDA